MRNRKMHRSTGASPKDMVRRKKHRFAREIMEALRQAGETAAIRYDAKRFSLTSQGGEKTCFLGNAYLEYQSIPAAARPDLVRKYVRAWFLLPAKVPTSFEDLKPDLLPCVRYRTTYEVQRLTKEPEVETPYLPLGEHLAGAVAYDLPEVIMDLNRDSLAEDDAARLVLPDLIRRHPVLGDHVAMVPNRELLIVTGSEDLAGLTLMVRLTAAGLQQARPLSGVALRLVGESWIPFLPPVEHPQHLPFKRLRLESIGKDYDCQKQALDALHREQGKAGFVANQLGPGEGDGKCSTICSWTVGVPTLLPRTDKVGFVGRKGNAEFRFVAIAPWERVQEVVGDLMEPVNVYPPRYRVRAFPTAEQLKAISAGK